MGPEQGPRPGMGPGPGPRPMGPMGPNGPSTLPGPGQAPVPRPGPSVFPDSEPRPPHVNVPGVNLPSQQRASSNQKYFPCLNPLTPRLEPCVIHSFLSFDSMDIHWKAIEQYFTVVLFVFQFFQICNFEKFVNF